MNSPAFRLKLESLIFSNLRKLKHSNSSQQAFMFDHYIEILISLSASLLAMNIAYIVFSLVTWSSTNVICVVFGVLLHYFLLNSFCWMLSLATLQYLMFNNVLIIVNRYFLKAALFSMCKTTIQFLRFYFL